MIAHEVAHFSMPCGFSTEPLLCPKLRRYGTMDYAIHSVPVAQLAHLVSTFPDSRWTLLRQSTLFEPSRRPNETIAWLAGLFGLRVATNPRLAACTHLSRRPRAEQRKKLVVNSYPN